tara:strand:- start:59 stop:409 length:351 start_codon:yes stop_codon:yes gene_type:complete
MSGHLINALCQLKPNGKYRAFEESDGTFTLDWDKAKNNGEEAPTLEELTKKAAEIEAGVPLDRLRKTRNELLAETDWMGNSDVPMSDAWKTYRQALRDLPANTKDPSNPTYPTKPT